MRDLRRLEAWKLWLEDALAMEDDAEVGMDDPIFSQPLRVRRVHVVGNARTRRSVIESELEEACRGRTVREVSTGMMKALSSLKQFECFEAVEVFCDVADGIDAARTDTEYTDVTVTVKEKRIVNLKAETYVNSTGSEGGVETSCSLTNPFGFVEKINAAASYGTKSASATRVEIVKPKIRGLPFTLCARAGQSTASRAIYSSFDECSRGVEVDLRHDSGRHSFGAESTWRDILPIRKEKDEFGYAASGMIIGQARPTLKNSLHYTFTDDRRDHAFGPTEGSLLRVRTELAGLGGDVDFVKNEVKVQQFLPVLRGLVPDAVLGFTFSAGLLYPLRAQPESASGEPFVGGSTAISDRFWLGGPMSLRGFDHKGVGPRTSPKQPGAKGGDSLGGDVTWSLGYSLYLPAPHPMLHAAGMRTQLFANAGNLCAFETSFNTLVRGMRTSVGAGLVFPTAMGRIEANYSFVLRANSRDQQRRFQLGLGLDFL